MFIRAANSRAGTGFTGDVNTSFREGRQDAFRDYIDNFNVALKADVANNAENNRNVQRVAQNYGLDLQMDQAARQDAYNFLKQSENISNQKLQTNIAFNRDARLSDPSVVNEVAKAGATEYVTKAQVDATKQQNALNKEQFDFSQNDIKNKTQEYKNQADLITAQTGITQAEIAKMGPENQAELIKIMGGAKDEDLIKEFILRYRSKYPDNNDVSDEQLRGYAMNDIVALRQEKTKQEGNKYLAIMKAAGGDFGNGDVVNFTNTGKQSKQASTKATTKEQEPKPVTTKTLGKVQGVSKEDFDKAKDKMVNLGNGVFRDGNAVVVDNGRGNLIRYEANQLSDGTWETLQDLQRRAVKDARGTAPASTTMTKPANMND